jgi:hypothetical protein
MYRDPDIQFVLGLHRQAELHREAQSARLARQSRCRPAQHRIRGLHLHIGEFIVAVGRTLYDEEAPRPKPLRS